MARPLYAVNGGRELRGGDPAPGEHAYRVAGADPDRLRTARHYLSADGRLDVHRQRQEHHGPNPATWRKHRQHHRYPSRRPASRWRGRAAAGPRTSTSSSSSAPPWSARLCRRRKDLDRLTMRVAANNFYSADREDDQKVTKLLRRRIKHVI